MGQHLDSTCCWRGVRHVVGPGFVGASRIFVAVWLGADRAGGHSRAQRSADAGGWNHERSTQTSSRICAAAGFAGLFDLGLDVVLPGAALWDSRTEPAVPVFV